MSKGLILYADGSAIPNPGWAGWGIHGYLFDDEKPKKGSGHPSHIPTNDGYKIKLDAAAKAGEVTVLSYLDISGPIAPPGTNNMGEVQGAAEALKLAWSHGVQSVTVITDSEYARKGGESWIEGWAANNWIKRDGMQIQNLDLWKMLYEYKHKLLDAGVKVKFNWVKGHKDDVGNIIADRLAGTGTRRAFDNHTAPVEFTSPPDGYWKYETDRHPFIDQRAMLFNTLKGSNEPGLYYLTGQDKESEMIGVKRSDGAYCVVRLNEPDSTIEMIRDIQVEYADKGHTDTLILCRLSKLFHSDVHQALNRFGKYALLKPNHRNLGLSFSDKEPVTRELNPALLAMREVEQLSMIESIMDRFVAKDPLLIQTDLTSTLYDAEIKQDRKGTETVSKKLKAEFVVGFNKLTAKVNHKQDDKAESFSIDFILGMDLPNRNALKRLEAKNPTVTAIGWYESDMAFRYATIVEVDDGIGIWAGVHSNLRIIAKAA